MAFVLINSNSEESTSSHLRLFSFLTVEDSDVLQSIKEELCRGTHLEAYHNGMNFLGEACYLGRYDIVKLVIDFISEDMMSQTCTLLPRTKKSYLDCYDNNSCTPLLLAIKGGYLEICRLLIMAGANINLPHELSKQTPLIIAIEQFQDSIVTLLLENHADVNICDNVGITPLYMAIKCKSERIIKQLIEAGCDVNIGSQDHAPIFLATRMGLLNVDKLLCEAGCHKDVKNKYGVTPVYEAALKGHIDVLQYLLEIQCNPDLVDMYDQSPLHVAVITGKLECVKLLVNANANMKLRNHNRDNAMDLALQMGKADIVRYFLEAGSDVMSRPVTPVSFRNLVAVLDQGHSSTLEVLIQGCARLPILHCISALPMFRNNTRLMKLLMHSGIKTVPASLLLPTSHQCQETSDWIKDFLSNPMALKDICRIRIRKSLGNKVFYKVKKLLLPNELKNFLTLNYC